MIWLTSLQLIKIHTQLTNKTGGSDGVRDASLLESALAQPLQCFGGEELFPDVLSKAVRLGFGLVANHPFVDGNKRIGALAMLCVLELNGISLHFSQQELSDVIYAVASGANFEFLLDWVKTHH